MSITKAASTSGRLPSPARLRAALRCGVLGAVLGAPLLAASSALAVTNVNYYGGNKLSVLQIIGIFVGIPVGLFLLITFLVVLPGWVKGDVNRKEVGWVGGGPTGTAGAQSAGKGGASSGTGGASGTW